MRNYSLNSTETYFGMAWAYTTRLIKILPELSLLFADTAVAVESPASLLPLVTVTAPRSTTDEKQEDGSDTSGLDWGRNVTHLAQPDLAVAHERTIDEILRGLPGISVTKGGGFGAGQLQLRGANGQDLVSLDGMPVLDTLPGVINLNALLPDGLESIDVKRGFGPSSQPFAALGGSIDMTSRTARDDSADLRMEGGSFGFLKETLRGNLVGEQARIAVTVNRSEVFDGSHHAQSSTGNTERDPFHGAQVLMKAGLDISNRIVWEGSLFYRESWNAIDGLGFRGGQLLPVDESGAYFNEESWMAQNRLKARIGDNWLSNLQVGYTHQRNRSITQGIDPGYTADLYLARWENDQRLWQGEGNDAMHLLWGGEGRYENAHAPTFRPLAPGVLLPGAPFAEVRNQQAGFIETRVAYGKFDGKAGVRYEDYSRFGSHALLHASAAWQIAPQWKLHANGGNGLRIPSYAEKLFPLLGNPNLKPERGTGGDLGLEWRPMSWTKLDVTGFYNRYDNLILISWNPAPSVLIPCLGVCASNLPNASVAGLETASEFTINDQWRTGASYTYTDSRNLDTGRRVPLRATNSIRVWGEWHALVLPLTFWAEGVFRGRSYNDVNNTLAIGDALRINVHASYQMTAKLDLYVRGENLTTKKTPDFYGLDFPGAAVYGGLAWKM